MQALISTLFGEGSLSDDGESVTFPVTDVIRFVSIVRTTGGLGPAYARIDAGDLSAEVHYKTLKKASIDWFDDVAVLEYCAEHDLFERSGS